MGLCLYNADIFMPGNSPFNCLSPESVKHNMWVKYFYKKIQVLTSYTALFILPGLTILKAITDCTCMQAFAVITGEFQRLTPISERRRCSSGSHCKQING